MGYITISERAEASFTEKKSEFIGYICPVADGEEAVAFINEIRAMHRRATHNVYAYITRADNISRFSDDGEPQGTAGAPVLEVLKKEGLTDVCCVVTRYFGGILLGGGGLVRAYSHAAKIACDAARKRIMHRAFPLTLVCDYNLYGKVSYILPEFEVKIADTRFEADVAIELLVKSEKCAALCDKLTDISNGQILIDKGDEIYGDFA